MTNAATQRAGKSVRWNVMRRAGFIFGRGFIRKHSLVRNWPAYEQHDQHRRLEAIVSSHS